MTSDEILRTAFTAITTGADAVITGRGHDTSRMLADEQIPVMGHLGFVPRKSTWVGGIRAVGKTATEALELWDRFRWFEDAGAFAVECEIIAAEVMAEINCRSGLVTVSLGSGPAADVMFLATSDICGESARLPAMPAPGAILPPCTRPSATPASRRCRASAGRLRTAATRPTPRSPGLLMPSWKRFARRWRQDGTSATAAPAEQPIRVDP
ncbi:3-methyl-2-oxobutanoate hydroxymethyltransferase [Mesorhizobium sp. 113-3-3]|uniref:3-methyl-2-oxobutanoate hydroxymethyltransferase n=1 Tax=Mesorhizobium sp. 113-3-3 TaxID=2744516 RepID=UPI001FD122CB|nr:3-methyl-2-oxobutanoate hydroxymethyltransferase [Mesorhizobium sp. 113-3-3]